MEVVSVIPTKNAESEKNIFHYIEELLPLATSWINPPDVDDVTDGYEYTGYERNERAFIFNRTGENVGNLEFVVKCSDESPLFNPVIIIKNWDEKNVDVRVTQNDILVNTDNKIGYRENLNRSDLILWMQLKNVLIYDQVI